MAATATIEQPTTTTTEAQPDELERALMAASERALAYDAAVYGERARLAHVERYIGNEPITKITAQTIERVYAAIRDDRKLGGTSMNRIHTLLKGVFKKAVDYDLILRNPCDKVTSPKKDEPTRRALSAGECARLASWCATTMPVSR